MTLDAQAIMRAYPTIVGIDDSWINYGVDNDGNRVYFEQSKVDAARVEIDAEEAASLYRRQRTGTDGSETTSSTTDGIYPEIGDQLDLLYKDIVNGTLTSSGEFAKAIKATKDKYPKP